MTHTDNQIDTILATLRDATPPQGLEARLLTTLEAAQTQATLRVPHPGSPTSVLGSLGWRVSILRHGWTTNPFSRRLWIPTALAAAILALVFAIHLHHASTPAPTPTTAAVQTPGIISSPSTPQPTVTVLHDAAHTARHPLFLSIPQRSGGTCISPTDAPCVSQTRTPNPYEQAALEDALAPSQPAPPLPLTRQEQLLLRILHRGDYTELAELNPAVRSAREARELADFQTFFPSPKPQPEPHSAPQTAPTAPGDKQ